MAGAIMEGDFEINFNRRPGSSDVRVPVHVLRDKPQAASAFNECMVKLIDVIQKKVGG
jgi:hypothetical protein